MSGMSELAEQYFREAAAHASHREQEMNSPAFIYKPRLFIDGNQWCALYGENIQNGVCGFGSSPANAYHNFNSEWYRILK